MNSVSQPPPPLGPARWPAVPLQAIFLDRDGVINAERADYVKAWDEVEVLPGALRALARLATLGLPLIVVTNQSAVNRGLMTRATLDAMHHRLQAVIEEHGGRIDAFYVCPHRPDEGCACRKPRPGLLLQAAQDYHVALGACVFVGDAVSDYQAAAAAGCACCLVRTGRQADRLSSLAAADPPPFFAADLASAVTLILAQARPLPAPTTGAD